MQVSRVIAAPRAHVFAAFTSADSLLAWLPPSGMHGSLETFEPRTGGGYRLTLTYEHDEGRGKTTSNTDVVNVEFVELVPDERIVESCTFETDDPAFAGAMIMTWTFEDAAADTRVALAVENAPAGISEVDHEAGVRSSLDNLARFVESR
jgi:uncharacterized protein YndB with AHSA1/START domain